MLRKPNGTRRPNVRCKWRTDRRTKQRTIFDMTNNEKYWSDYTDFLRAVSHLTKSSPADLLESYADLVESLETKTFENYMLSEYEADNDLYFRTIIQHILNSKEIADNLLFLEFKSKIIVLDKRIKPFLENECASRTDWYKKIRLNPSTYS
jgi:hypothetical protein